MNLGFIGLGKMGSRMAGKLLTEGHDLVVWNRTREVVDEFTKEYQAQAKGNTLQLAATVSQLVKQLPAPRVIWLMLPAGEVTEEMLIQLTPLLSGNDVVIDGGNANFKDTQRRFEQLKAKNIRFLGIGVSGGLVAAKEGYPLMVGGDKSAYEEIKPILQSLAKPSGGYEYFGQGGAGHFVKMVHNGIEYGYMQALGEGFEVLEKSDYDFDLLKVAQLYTKGTLLSGFMMDRVVDALTPDPSLKDIDGVIAESGEAKWTVEEAKKEGVKVEIIERSLEYRKQSQVDTKIANSYTAKLIAALRHAFGGHEVKTRI